MLHKIEEQNTVINAKIKELTQSREEFSLITENISPVDLIPDFIPVLGYPDDVLLLPR